MPRKLVRDGRIEALEEELRSNRPVTRQEGNDVVKPCGANIATQITARPANPKLLCDDHRSPVDLRPGEAFSKARRIYLIVDERVRRTIGLLAG